MADPMFIYIYIYILTPNKNTKQGNMAVLSAPTDPHKQSFFILFLFFNGK